LNFFVANTVLKSLRFAPETCISNRPMPFRKAICFLALALVLAGCKSGDSDPQFKAVTGRKPPGARTTAAVEPPPANQKPAVRPADVLNGRVIAVKEPLKFVIVDFLNSRLPQLDQQLSVYRLDQKVAEIKVSGPYLGTTVVADVTAGQALEGDLVRDR
jgi:hypothetical protein